MQVYCGGFFFMRDSFNEVSKEAFSTEKAVAFGVSGFLSRGPRIVIAFQTSASHSSLRDNATLSETVPCDGTIPGGGLSCALSCNDIPNRWRIYVWF
jgi:hypothetical protein